MALLARLALGVPSVPPPTSSNASALLDAISKAAAAAEPTFTIAPGKYVFSNIDLLISGASNLQLRAYDVTVVFYYGYGLQLHGCHNVSVHGLTLDSDPPNYAQGVLSSLSADGHSFVAKFDDRFIPPDTTKQPFSSPGGQAGAKTAFCNATTLRFVPS